jgi:DNA-binding CsgD family transcriptional regulator
LDGDKPEDSRMLIGREDECARIDRLLAAAEHGRSAVAVVLGEPGIGKSALLRYAADRATGMARLEVHGFESDSELPFAGLLELCRPALGHLDRLPGAQSSALRGALALGPALPGERFAVQVATLGLLAAVAESSPLIVLVDDAHWLDQASAEALLFAARRLEAEGIVLLFAAREGERAVFEASGLEEFRVGPLPPDAAARLLADHAPVPPASGVTEQLVLGTAGNPLALIELATVLTNEQLTGLEPLSEPLPLGASAERAFARRIDALGERVRRALLLAAASASGDLGPILRTAPMLGIDAGDLEQAEAAGLVTVTRTRLSFHHPLVRSAVYSNAPAAQRRAVHRLLADELAGPQVADERAWHLAAASFGPDEEAAAALEQAALSAQRRVGFASAVAAFERAAQLSPDPEAGARRLFAAADAARLAGQNERALALLDRALASTGSAQLRVAIQHVRGRIEFIRGQARTAYELLSTEAEPAREPDPDLAATMLAEAAIAALMAGDAPTGLVTAIDARNTMRTAGGSAELITMLILGTANYRLGQTAEGFRLLLPAATIAERRRGQDPDADYVVFAALTLIWVGEHDRAGRLLRRLIDEARAASALGVLPNALFVHAHLKFRTGQWTQAYADAAEAVRLAGEIENALWHYFALGSLAIVAAGQGREGECRRHAREALELVRGLELEYPRDVGDALGLLELGLGRPEAAIEHLEPVNRVAVEQAGGAPVLVRSSTFDLVEAYIRAGRPLPEAVDANLVTYAERVEFDVLRASAWRCRGLAAGDDFDPFFQRALELHQSIHMPFAEARTAFCYGERLRRAGRRVESRLQLRAALTTFERLGARPWAERAAAELRATGETVRRRNVETFEELTPQELQIALVVANGATNREAGAGLFLSPKTVEFHLGRVYRKLGVRSRTELARLLAGQDASARSPAASGASGSVPPG